MSYMTEEEHNALTQPLLESTKEISSGHLVEPCSDDSPWPLRDVVATLVKATNILLHEKDYDGHGHEVIVCARDHANAWLEYIAHK